jgi:predicted nucleotidyltransferase component of viral defense system
MEVRSEAQVIEIFHLLFLQVLTSHSRNWFVLKGGANLRYYFGSLRYSNDIDLDFAGREGWHVEQSVDSALTGRALSTLLEQQGLAIGESSKPKQTDTTRRWTLGLVRQSVSDPLIRTKVEFSNRGVGHGDVLYETVPHQVVDSYAIRPVTLSHYGLTAALEQKIAALALRGEMKARDVFDLELLLRLRRASGDTGGLDLKHAAQAEQRALEISYASFRSEVIPFLDPDIAVMYESEDEWKRIRTGVIDEIEALEVSKSAQENDEND